jgi:choice-of-anchor B domain-containing protein
VSPALRSIALAAPAFLLFAGASGGPGIRPMHDEPLAVDEEALRRLAQLEGPAPCVDGLAAEFFPCEAVTLESFVSLGELLPGSISTSGLWGFADMDDRREYAVIGLNTGTAVVDVTVPSRPRVVGSIPGPDSEWREVKLYQHWNPIRRRHDAYAYVVSEAKTAGLQILDLSNLPDSVSLAATFRGFDTAHTVFMANVDHASGAGNIDDVPPVLYIAGSNEGFLALDVSEPDAPGISGRLLGAYVHDVWAGVFRGGRASPCGGHDPCEIVVDWGVDVSRTGNRPAIKLIDFTDKARPALIGEFQYPDLYFAHSGWISRDGNYLFSFDELDEMHSGLNTRIRVLDVSDLARPALAAVWTGSTRATEHNGHVVGDRLYVSHYERGLTVFDVSTPAAPREVAFFDTFPSGDDPPLHGAWGVYPFLPSGTLVVSNFDGAPGLFVLREGTGSPPPPGNVSRAPILRAEPGSRSPRERGR